MRERCYLGTNEGKWKRKSSPFSGVHRVTLTYTLGFQIQKTQTYTTIPEDRILTAMLERAYQIYFNKMGNFYIF